MRLALLSPLLLLWLCGCTPPPLRPAPDITSLAADSAIAPSPPPTSGMAPAPIHATDTAESVKLIASPAQAAPATAPKNPLPQPGSYQVDQGENLWTIAARSEIYNDPWLWPLIYRANRDQIKDPKQVYPGQTLRIPRHVRAEEIAEALAAAKLSAVFPVDPTRK